MRRATSFSAATMRTGRSSTGSSGSAGRRSIANAPSLDAIQAQGDQQRRASMLTRHSVSTSTLQTKSSATAATASGDDKPARPGLSRKESVGNSSAVGLTRTNVATKSSNVGETSSRQKMESASEKYERMLNEGAGGMTKRPSLRKDSLAVGAEPRKSKSQTYLMSSSSL